MNKKALIFVANGTEETEAVATVDMLRRAGIQVDIAGVGGDVVECAHGVWISTDMSQRDAGDGSEYDMIIIPGGMPGTLNLKKSATVTACLKKAFDDGRFVGAICAAPIIPGELGLLAGRKVTCYPGYEKSLTGAEYISDKKALRDGNLITGAGPGAVFEFAALLIEALEGADKRADVMNSAIAL